MSQTKNQMATDTQPPRESIPKLSKSRFLSGLQCARRLWLECYQRELAAAPDDRRQAILDSGSAVGVLARDRFAGGLLVSEDHLHHDDAARRTKDLLADARIPAIYEAAFTFDDVRVRADILARTGDGGFDLIEVKAGTGVKVEHDWDLAVQLHVLESAGVPIRRACLLHIDSGYVYRGGAYDLEALFHCADRTEVARARQADVVAALAGMRRSLRLETEPEVATGPHCTRPWPCPFYEHCHRDAAQYPVADLPAVGERLLTRLAADGIADVREIPEGFEGLRPAQWRAWRAIRNGQSVVESAIQEALDLVRFPVHFLDFETFAPALPRYVGTHPYQTICFQWSDHVLSDQGSVEHREFLPDVDDDPRRRFAESLLAAVSGSGSIVVYSGYEERCLRELEIALPDLAADLGRVREQIFDLLPVIRGHVYHADFEGSFSLKAVLPALLPNLGYDGLLIRDGALASLAWMELVDPATPAERAEALRRGLLEYCARDTEAILEIFRLLRT